MFITSIISILALAAVVYENVGTEDQNAKEEKNGCLTTYYPKNISLGPLL